MKTIRKPANRFARKTLVWMAIFFSMLFLILRSVKEIILADEFYTICMIIALPLIGYGFGIWVSRRFRCPQCGAQLPVPMKHKASICQPLEYFCSDCDIIWETGFYINGQN